VNITVRLFASYREAVGRASVEVSLAEGDGGEALWRVLVDRFPKLAALPAPAGYAVNDEYVNGLHPLSEADRIALIPPVSGGDPHSPLIRLIDRPIPIDQVIRDAADRSAGAIVLFLGVVRDNAHGRRVEYLAYEAYEALAKREMEKIAAAAGARWAISRIVIIHRTGRLDIGEASVAIAVSAPHRADAFAAGQFAIDSLKQTVPIWKKEVWEGGEAWIGASPSRPSGS
jgi:MoaE-MoaD fusion protein